LDAGIASHRRAIERRGPCPEAMVMLFFIRWLAAAALAAHGIAHAAGFAVAWRLMASPDLPYHTTVFNGRLDVGDTGMRLVGLAWLVAAFAFVMTAWLLLSRHQGAPAFVIFVALASLVLCAVEWPFARVGLFIDLALILTVPVITWTAASSR
jgi:hypothetical protein